ncbi:hypothetical protein GWK47_000127 [Chionoecetes opilio]|uniref:Uncharacterized protein n=1 Tax=Chionoecetes opilio TaxID=41210 RepID=A0A8J4Y3G1_CHIOP|nr:hypothetical protein GWK47_000127 [Chionoecetes opilio]
MWATLQDMWNEHGQVEHKEGRGRGSAVLGRVAKTPACLALAKIRAVRFNWRVYSANIKAIRKRLPFESDFGNVGRLPSAAPGWGGVAVNCNGIINHCPKAEEGSAHSDYSLSSTGQGIAGGWKQFQCKCKSSVGHDAEWVADQVFKVGQCSGLGFSVNYHQAGPVGAGME